MGKGGLHYPDIILVVNYEQTLKQCAAGEARRGITSCAT